MLSTLLLIDDHELMRQGLRDWLKLEFPECHVIEAASGEEAIAMVQVNVPQIVLMDVNLPGMDGFQATARLKKIAPAIPVVIVTFHDDKTYRDAATIAGAEAYVVKGRLLSELQPTLAALLPTSNKPN
jgi:NarL family two-component system response regulator LiaR